MLNVAYYQFAPKMGEREENLLKVRHALQNLSAPIDIMVLPELFSTGYAFSTRQEVAPLAENAQSGPTISLLKELAREKNMHIFGGFPEKAGDKIYNSSLLVSPEGQTWTYRKAHLFNEEKILFDKSDTHLEPIQITVGEHKIKVGLMICFDWIFPETARTLALKGAEILLHTTNLVLPYCPAATITRALENRVFIVLCDRVGSDWCRGKEVKFTGLSRIVSPRGEILVSSDERSEEIKWVSLDPQEAQNKKLNPYNDLFEDRRSDLYSL